MCTVDPLARPAVVEVGSYLGPEDTRLVLAEIFDSSLNFSIIDLMASSSSAVLPVIMARLDRSNRRPPPWRQVKARSTSALY